jgi:tetratricopeptide (TPR) repeat protein
MNSLRLWVVFLNILLVLTLSRALNAGAPYLSRSTHIELTQIRKLMDTGAHEKARDRLQILAQRSADRSYDLAMVQQHLGYTFIALNEYSKASHAFQESVDLEVLPEKALHPLYYLLAQLYIHHNAYNKGLKYLEKWLTIETRPRPQAHVLAAHAYYSTKRYSRAANHLQQALAKSEKPEASWFQFLAQIYLEQRRFVALERLLNRAIRAYPGNRVFWHALANLHLEQQQEAKALAVLMLAYRQKVLDEQDLPYVARLHIHQGAPEKAARLLELWEEEGQLDISYHHLNQQARSWLLAREQDKALKTLQRASKLTEEGAPDLLMAKLLFDQGRWSESLDHAQQALKKGGVEDVAEARFLLALAAYHDGQHTLAIAVLEKLRSDNRLGPQAEQWLRRIQATKDIQK